MTLGARPGERDLASVDFFTDESLLEDPYPYFEFYRSRGPVHAEPHHGSMVVTGYEEALEIYRNPEVFSSCNVLGGPFPGLPVEPEGDDIGDLIRQHRHVFPISDSLVSMDPPEHTDHRFLLMRLLTPRRLRENEEFMAGLSDRLVDGFLASGRCELIEAYAHPYAVQIIAELLGVPESDHPTFVRGLSEHLVGNIESGPGADADANDGSGGGHHLSFLDRWFSEYIEDRRRSPRDDVLTKLALGRFPDGSIPEPIAVARVANMVFSAGQGTSVHLVGTALRMLAEHPELQQQLRAERQLVPNYVEEVLRLESPIKTHFRLARRTTSLGGVPIPAGTTLMIHPGAANRDPGHFEAPDELRVDRPNAVEHLSFGRGIHTCPGASLARAEARLSVERLLDRTRDLRVSEAAHGPPDRRHYPYEPSFFLRRLAALHVEFTPVA